MRVRRELFLFMKFRSRTSRLEQRVEQNLSTIMTIIAAHITNHNFCNPTLSVSRRLVHDCWTQRYEQTRHWWGRHRNRFDDHESIYGYTDDAVHILSSAPKARPMKTLRTSLDPSDGTRYGISRSVMLCISCAMHTKMNDVTTVLTWGEPGIRTSRPWVSADNQIWYWLMKSCSQKNWIFIIQIYSNTLHDYLQNCT